MSSVSNRSTSTARQAGDSAGNGAGRRTSRTTRMSTVDVLRNASEQLAQLTGRTPDTVSAVERVDDGWRLEVEVLELERIPATTNILASYEVSLDDSGNVVGYRRLRRYFRNAAEEG